MERSVVGQADCGSSKVSLVAGFFYMPHPPEITEEIKAAVSKIWGLVLAARDADRGFVNVPQLNELNSAISAVRKWPDDHPLAGRADAFCDEAIDAAREIEETIRCRISKPLKAYFKVLMAAL